MLSHWDPTISLMGLGAVRDETRKFCSQKRTPVVIARWVFPVPEFPIRTTFLRSLIKPSDFNVGRAFLPSWGRTSPTSSSNFFLVGNPACLESSSGGSADEYPILPSTRIAAQVQVYGCPDNVQGNMPKLPFHGVLSRGPQELSAYLTPPSIGYRPVNPVRWIENRKESPEFQPADTVVDKRKTARYSLL